MNLKFFGKADRNADGEIASEYPAWMKIAQMDALEEEISMKKRNIERGVIIKEQIIDEREEIEKAERRLEQIMKSRPKLTSGQKDLVAKCYRAMSESIGESMFSRSEMKLGLADPGEEAIRMTKAHLKAPSEFDEIFQACNVKPTNGKLTRNQASKVFKICGSLLDAYTNAERCRKDRKTEALLTGERC